MERHVYCCADLHGRYDLFQQIKDYLGPDDICYVLGDCGDRGPDGWAIIKEVWQDPRFVYIKGNHEDMLMRAMLGQDIWLCMGNGGGTTYEAWAAEYPDGEINPWARRLRDLPLEEIYINKQGQRIVLTHAGYTPHLKQFLWGDDYLWNRQHFTEDWDEDYVDTIVVHGHTICPTLFSYLYSEFPKDYNFADPTIIRYCDGHKIDMDLGSAFTGKVALLDLDSLEETYFYSDIYSKYQSDMLKYKGRETMYWR